MLEAPAAVAPAASQPGVAGTQPPPHPPAPPLFSYDPGRQGVTEQLEASTSAAALGQLTQQPKPTAGAKAGSGAKDATPASASHAVPTLGSQGSGGGPPAAAMVEHTVQPHPVSAAATALQVLEALLNRIGQMDVDGFFEEPVREEDAPGYYDFIEHPMCFQTMRQKLRAREYRTWGAFVADFELICNNAMTYNQRRSRVHKQAVTMLRAGKKQLQHNEAHGRKALAALHPNGPAAAAADEQLFLAGSPRALTSSLSHRNHSFADTNGHGEADELLLDMQTEDEECYSSFSETDLEDAHEPSLPASQHGPLAPGFAPAAIVQPWEPGLQPTDGDPQQCGSPRGRSAEWKSERRGVEWRCRWLELRLQELKQQERRYQRKLQRLQYQEDAQAEEAPAGPSTAAAAPPAGAAAATASVPADPGSSKPDSNPLSSGAARPHRKHRGQQLRRRRHRSEQRELSLSELLHHPFYGEQAGLLDEPAADGNSVQDVDSDADAGCYPARVYAALELLDRHMGALKQQLLAKQAPGRPGPQKVARPGKTSRGARAAALAPGSRRLVGAPAKTSLQRKDSRLGKRGRSDFDFSDMIVPGSSMGPKFVERLQVSNISIPQVRPLPQEELAKRSAAVAAWGARLKGTGPAEIPADLVPLIQPSGEGSSSEDTGDEVYVQRHAPREEEERNKFMFHSGGAQKKNPNTSKSKPKASNAKLVRNESTAAVDSKLVVSAPAPPMKAASFRVPSPPDLPAIATALPAAPSVAAAEAAAAAAAAAGPPEVEALSAEEQPGSPVPKSPLAEQDSPSRRSQRGVKGRGAANGTARPRGRPPGSGNTPRPKGQGKPPAGPSSKAMNGTKAANSTPGGNGTTRSGRTPGPGGGHKAPQTPGTARLARETKSAGSARPSRLGVRDGGVTKPAWGTHKTEGSVVVLKRMSSNSS